MNYKMEHVLKAIENSTIVEHPYPHIIVDDILPQELYNQIVKENEEFKIWSVYHKPSQKRKNNKRTEIHILSEASKSTDQNEYFDFAGIHNSIKNFENEVKNKAWNEFRNILTSRELQNVLLNKFSKYLENRIENLDKNKMIRNIQFNKDSEGFKIDPHTDTEFKLLFGLFYLAKDDKNPNLSTGMYVHKKGLRSWRTTPLGAKLKNEDFEKVKEVEYLPNRMAMFLKNDISWHGVDIPRNDISRYTVYYSLCNPVHIDMINN